MEFSIPMVIFFNMNVTNVLEIFLAHKIIFHLCQLNSFTYLEKFQYFGLTFLFNKLLFIYFFFF